MIQRVYRRYTARRKYEEEQEWQERLRQEEEAEAEEQARLQEEFEEQERQRQPQADGGARTASRKGKHADGYVYTRT